MIMALIATTKLSNVKLGNTGIGDLKRAYHPGIYPGHSAWPSLCGYVQWVLATVSATAGKETASYANSGSCYQNRWHTGLYLYLYLWYI